MPRMDWIGDKQHWFKICSKCKEEFNVEGTETEAWDLLFKYFLKGSNRDTDGLSAWCRSCTQRVGTNRIGLIHRDKLLEAQDGKCAICEKLIRFNGGTEAGVDHNHTTGIERGVLCQPCNNKMKVVDDKEWLIKAIAYRDKH